VKRSIEQDEDRDRFTWRPDQLVIDRNPTPATASLPRNDVAACVAYYEARGQITAEELQAMEALQDDPAALRQAATGWRVLG
jgi:hypothetical protein